MDRHSQLSELENALEVIYLGIADFQGSDPQYRLMKIGEEFGEVVQAYIGAHGKNKRKGFGSVAEVKKELADVLITAFVALFDFDDYPISVLTERVDQIQNRIKEQGS